MKEGIPECGNIPSDDWIPDQRFHWQSDSSITPRRNQVSDADTDIAFGRLRTFDSMGELILDLDEPAWFTMDHCDD